MGTRQTTAPVTSIATDGTSLFYTLAGPAGEIWSAPVALNSPGTRIFSRGSSYLGNLSLMTGGILLWTDIGNRSVNQMMTNGQNVFTLYQAPANISPGQVVSADDYTYVAWLESNGRVMKSTDYMVTKSLVATLQSSDGLALDGTNLYVADGTAGTIWRFSRSTSQAYQFAIQQSGVRSIAVDATNVYWMSSSALMKAPIGGGSPVALPTGQPCFFSEVKLDDKAIYWLNACGFGNNYVMKLAK